MIAGVRGEVLEIGLDHAVVEVGGVGLAVHATPATLARLRRGEQARMATSLVVRTSVASSPATGTDVSTTSTSRVPTTRPSARAS